jgi:hypothetical protein
MLLMRVLILLILAFADELKFYTELPSLYIFGRFDWLVARDFRAFMLRVLTLFFMSLEMG